MTRKVDRVHEARRADDAAAGRRIDWTLGPPMEKAGDILRASLGIPADLRIGFGQAPDAANDAAIDKGEEHNRA